MLTGGPLATLFKAYDFQQGATYVAAVSGGSDSTALLILLKAHLDKSYPGARLIAATVDHGLRPASAAEAETVAVFCRAQGMEHRILKWTGQKPVHGIQLAARLARHRLLAELAMQEGAAAVFTGHTRDDQAETVLMRGARGDGPGGAGIAPATLYDGRLWFMRPLLNTGRVELRERLIARGIGWIDDPSNVDARFERARLRAALREAPDGNFRTEDAIASAAEAAALRAARAYWTAGLLRIHAVRAAPGLIRLARPALDASDETVLHALQVLVAVAGGAEHLPDVHRTKTLLQKLRAGRLRANLSRALVDARKDAIFFLREARGVPPEPAHASTVWDRRYEIVADGESGRVDSSRFDRVPASLVGAAANAEPLLPENCGKRPLVAPWARFLPVLDLPVANEAARLVGARSFPPPPFRGHIEKTV